MNKKIVVYAISKSESQFVDRWYNSMKEADSIYVLDTGSTDDTVSKLRGLGVHVSTEIITPWRFDVARNKSLDLVPLDTDICVCTDLDEVLEPGWRKKLEDSWSDDTNRLRYTYNWSLDQFNNPKVSFLYEKIHDRLHYRWIHPVHEILECSLDNETVVTNEEIVLNHYPDTTKSRSSYLPLLELSVEENPDNDRNLHYLGREYMYYGEWEKSIEVLKKHASMETAWDLERAASNRFISRCLINLGKTDEALEYLDRAILLSPNNREAYVEKALYYFGLNNYLDTIKYCIKAKTIVNHNKLYINEVFCYDETIDDLLSISFYNLGFKDEALFYVDKALLINPNNERIQKNKEIFKS